MVIQNSNSPAPVYLMAKPIGAVCNLNCSYCYYLEKEQLYPNDPHKWHMSENMLKSFIAQYIYASGSSNVLFTWHGGEPIMRGMDFFKKVIEFQKKYGEGRTISNSLQTNGTTLTDEWCRFFKEHNFLIGFSIDGPEHCHDHYRKYRNGDPSFAKAMKGLELLKKYNIEFNTLSVVNDYNSKYPLEVYSFLKSIGSHYMQFTPIVERSRSKSELAEWTVDATGYGDFLIQIFDEWVRKDVGEYFVVTFDCVLANWMGVPPSLCIAAETCGHAGAVEFNGDVYSCDHYVFPEYKLGNISNNTIMDLMHSPYQLQFGLNKRDLMPGYCRRCEYLDLCNGECPKNRIIQTPDGEPGLNYLCSGFRKFYRHTEPYFGFMANELKENRAPSNVMQWIRSKEQKAKVNAVVQSPPKQIKVNRNDPCPCNSGKLYKNCCKLKPKNMR